MVQLKHLGLLLVVTLGYCSKQRKFLIFPESKNNFECRSLSNVQFIQTVSEDGRTRTFDLHHTSIIGGITIRTCDYDRALAVGHFNITYIDASDSTNQERIYSEGMVGDRSLFRTSINLDIEPVLYTRRLSFSHWHAIECSEIHIQGCSPNDICGPTFCKNGGTCVGNGQCACGKGYMGPTCEQLVQNMTFDDFGFVASLSDVLYTKVAAFSVTGDVSFSFKDQDKQTGVPRNTRTLGLLFGLAHICGHGGSLHYMPSHMPSFEHNHHNTLGHLPSHSTCSALNNFETGFTHTIETIFGDNHHHSNTQYFYTTHGTDHFSHGVSLHTSNHCLHMHVHYANSLGHLLHYHLSPSFNPWSNTKYIIESSFSPHCGASLYVNGHHVASLTKPNVTSPLIHFPGTPKPLCFGLCGAHPGAGPNNITIGNIAVAGANVVTLANNFLLGLLGLPMLNILTPPQHTSAGPQTKPTASLQPMATATDNGLALSPASTLPPASATTALTNAATTKSHAPICYACTNKILDGDCSTTYKCFVGEVCSVFHGSQGYTHRCMDRKLCDSNLKNAKDCWKCCTGDLCNDKCGGDCTDKPQCSQFLSIGYNACIDPAASVSFCPKTCNKCPSRG
ncbi:uncharacterized protein LOC123546943 [Mercenaria mercenaria]|uniref:uncharacterized protein LOC123546943 n=1 Tax=Mercenaria mercenaria TaxID=6596 RepID=UPI00234EDF62|nr:uncharacterized protein LOC123546943 [Mercenaria mercenaria]